ncbi:winged helix DNA-binding protein [Photobacterium phosphoreum]|jgi:DNA-binding MarR family transcriptional regulator|uniref:Winged helix DNA-binding protein n=2 Tax=Photobacterium phosphoreum TaxID=659 RepID=A0AAW4ZLG9_PHOPO|nr:winged helix DNA-binding protein [Photobacterium phosphoreum]KJF84660.1 MarR family transcriptional regulator [Photobacterium phosphoreum]MCD9461957.1 MarR family transcriptional regulator [Photobacterium phosphoreum]MCD9469482.1 MarR family transcriptional regulator [Photobacterium phosphoreum]MCD9475217.1 winged helix DNA-binding protein [Photobacterium phosphoreum]MCD9479035.1 winged helix DNA-binding protein [Photobacterium phosphoreum]
MHPVMTNIPELDSSLSFTLGLTYKQFRTIANQSLNTQFDITLEMLGALRVLDHLGEIPQQAVAEALQRERSVTKRLIDNCIKRDLIEAKKSDTNKKARYLAITAKGAAIKQQADVTIKAITADFYAPLNQQEQQLLLSLCRRLIKPDFILGNDN